MSNDEPGMNTEKGPSERARVAYPAREIEQRWQQYWREQRVFATNPEPKKKFYVLEMFIYPSGDMHMGHARNYTIGDVIGRYRKMQGYDVLHPFGWDAFGLPAENAAIAHGNHPREWTFASIDLCKRNLNLMGIAYDWDREINTCLPEYYRWDQWLFLQFYRRGLAYRKEALLNWCPKCQTVLANEQVIDGRCYRSACNAVIEKRKMTQWFFRITDYAQELLDDIDTLEGWPDSVRIMQRNWIGRSEGVEVDFVLAESGEKIKVFTTRPDTLYGVTFMALAPDSELAERIARGTEHEREVEEFRKRIILRPEMERLAATGDKEGVFTGKYAVNPLTGDQVPIYLADFVLASYGTGMVMAVPGHDQRDFEFARKYNIPIKVVIQNPDSPLSTPDFLTQAYTDVGAMVNSGPFDGTRSDEGIEKVIAHLEKQGIGRRMVNYRLKDWLISRQRYWGAPIPMIHCQKCGIVPVPEDQLPVVLPPDVTDFKPRGTSVLASVKEFYETTCPACGGPAHRDPDTMDTFVNSSWYMVRYADPHNEQLPFSKAAADAWLPIDEYIGGIEHATGHLIFFRFFTKVMADLGLLSFREPCRVLHTQGMVAYNGVTMSSSKNVGVWVGPFTAEYGADAARLAVLFAAPPDKGMDWTEDLVTGVTRFLNRVWRLFEEHGDRVTYEPPATADLAGAGRSLYIRLNQMLQKVTADTEAFQYNTAIAAQMEFLNDLGGFEGTDSPVFGFCLGRLVFCLAPFAPHLAEELWHRARPDAGSLFNQRFPEVDTKFLVFDEMVIPVQVDGKLRDRVSLPRTATEAEVKKAALECAGIAAYLAGRRVAKVIYVKDRLVNVVLAKE
jgi:leucyl-tRNA synthetase